MPVTSSAHASHTVQPHAVQVQNESEAAGDVFARATMSGISKVCSEWLVCICYGLPNADSDIIHIDHILLK